MVSSGQGLADVAREEGLRTEPYNDGGEPKPGHATIGVGHLIHHGPVTAADRARYRGFTRRDAIRLLRRDIKIAESAVNMALRREVPQRAFDACVSLAFNIGVGGFRSSTVARMINAGNMMAAANAFLLWDNPSILRPRRERERKIFIDAFKHDVDPLAVLTPTERRWCREYDRLKKADKERARRTSLRRVMKAQRKRIWHAAQKDGWVKAHRRERYAQLMKRTK